MKKKKMEALSYFFILPIEKKRNKGDDEKEKREGGSSWEGARIPLVGHHLAPTLCFILFSSTSSGVFSYSHSLA